MRSVPATGPHQVRPLDHPRDARYLGACPCPLDGMLSSPVHVDQSGTRRAYVRFAALGDSATFGLGDQDGDHYRGWASLLVAAMRREHDVSSCNLAVPGARAADVRAAQLATALEHRPQL